MAAPVMVIALTETKKFPRHIIKLARRVRWQAGESQALFEALLKLAQAKLSTDAFQAWQEHYAWNLAGEILGVP